MKAQEHADKVYCWMATLCDAINAAKLLTISELLEAITERQYAVKEEDVNNATIF